MVMELSIVEYYLNELPRELIKAVNPLSNKKELALFICILKEGPFRFHELKERFEAHQQEISKGLNSLVVAGLIEKRADISEEGFADISYYMVSALGESIMRSLVKGTLFIDSYPESLRRLGKCAKEWNDFPPIHGELLDCGTSNIKSKFKIADQNARTFNDISQKYQKNLKPERRIQYEPKKA
jgi:predicted transcriptional regulator